MSFEVDNIGNSLRCLAYNLLYYENWLYKSYNSEVNLALCIFENVYNKSINQYGYYEVLFIVLSSCFIVFLCTESDWVKRWTPYRVRQFLRIIFHYFHIIPVPPRIQVGEKLKIIFSRLSVNEKC